MRSLIDRAKSLAQVAVDIWTTLKKRCPHAHSRNNSKQPIKISQNHPHDYAMKQ
jgi:hypothetical protein